MKNAASLLATLYDTKSEVKSLGYEAGLSTAHIDFDGSLFVCWVNLLNEAKKQHLEEEVLRQAAERFPTQERALAAAFRLDSSSDKLKTKTKFGVIDWQPNSDDTATLEKIIGKQPTFLPVSYLNQGLERSKSVCRIKLKTGYATGFLISESLVLTNRHVFPERDSTNEAEFQFNYETDASGVMQQPDIHLAVPDGEYLSSSDSSGEDWAVVEIPKIASAKWGFIRISENKCATGDFINIIQHPHGAPKQIAFYHNSVAYADDTKVQYLTDTSPGSSGSPVFDSEWEVVSLHHSGGWLLEPNTHKSFFRNEGTSIGIVVQRLREAGINLE